MEKRKGKSREKFYFNVIHSSNNHVDMEYMNILHSMTYMQTVCKPTVHEARNTNISYIWSVRQVGVNRPETVLRKTRAVISEKCPKTTYCVFTQP